MTSGASEVKVVPAPLEAPIVFLCYYYIFIYWFGFMVFNATFNNISVILWRSDLLVEETGVSGENHQIAASH